MKESRLIRRIQMDCPICSKVHEIGERTRAARTKIKGEDVDYLETYYYCANGDADENEFSTGKMESENLMNARNAYRKKHMWRRKTKRLFRTDLQKR